MEELVSLSDLLDLQRLDSELDRLLDRRQSLPELEEYRHTSEDSAEADSVLEALEQQLRETELAVDKADGELQIMEEKVVQTERRLFAGGMSARETENMRLDVESLRRRQSELETAVLEGLERRDELRSQTEASRHTADQLRRKKEGLEEKISGIWKEIDTEIASKEARKVDLVPLIEAELLDLYESLRSLKEGVAVAPLESGICGGCHLRLSAAELEEALAGNPPRCTHCRRILVS